MALDEAGAVPLEKKDMLQHQATLGGKPNDKTVLGGDGDQGIAQRSLQVASHFLQEISAGFSKFLENWFGIVNAHHYFFLALLGTITAAICFCTDLISVYLIDRKSRFKAYNPFLIVKLQIVRNENIDYHIRYLLYVAFVVVFMLIAVSMS